MRLKPTKATLGILAGLLGVIALSFGGLNFALARQTGAVQEKVDARQLELSDGERIADRRDQAAAALASDREQIRFLESGVSSAAYVPTLLRQIEQVAVSTRNQVLAVRPVVESVAPSRIQQRRDVEATEKPGEGGEEEKKTVEEPYNRLNIEITLVGRYRSAQDFVQQLTRFPKIVGVNAVTIRPHRSSAQTGETDDSLLNVQLKVTAYVMKGDSRTSGPAVTASAAVPGGIN